MIVEFRVKNFRSFKDEQILSFVAGQDETFQEQNTISTHIKSIPSILRSTVVYGANASGKSNLIKAIQYMRGVVVESASSVQPGQAFNVKPFRLDNTSDTKPVEFEVTFILDGIRHQYGFALDSERIVNEYLLVYKTIRPQAWFERYYDSETQTDHYEFSSFLKGRKSLWQDATRQNALFLSMAAQLNSELLKPVYDWFSQNLVIFNSITPLSPKFSIEMLRTADGKKDICDFLRGADISIDDIDVATRKVPGKSVHVDVTTGKTTLSNSEVEENILRFYHRTSQGNAIFNLEDESDGTRALVFLAGPILDILKKGRVLIVDELDTSLHALLVRRLIGLFHNHENDAQLIFTTHDTSLLDNEIFRRDQIWFVEKNSEQVSTLFALAEFSPRKNEALERGYLMGRYGAVPFFADHG